MKKTIFITSFHPLISRNILSSGILDVLVKNNIKVVIIAPKNKESFFKENFERDDVIVEGFEFKNTKRENLLKYLSLTALNTKTLYIKRKTEMKGSGMYLTYLLSNKIGHKFVRFLERVSYKNKRFEKLFDQYKPDCIFSTDIQSELDIAILNEGIFSNIKTAGMVRSWDNLTSKGLIRVIPNKLLVWNNIIKDEAICLQEIRESMISVIGIPHYDDYKKNVFTNRKEFIEKIGGDQDKKLALFIPLGDRYLRNNTVDRDIVDILDKTLPKDYQLLVRLPPGDYVRELENNPKFPNLKVIYDRAKPKFDNIKITEIDKNDDVHLAETLFWSELVISSPSTFVLDSAYMNKPIILFGFDGYEKREYFDSIRRYYDYNNFIPVIESGGVKLAESMRQFKDYLDEYVKNPSLDKDKRKKLAEMEAGFLDGKNTERLFNAILDLINK
jgi:hypothetical protein